jgi:pimeloyl-ACP methyl ester carboxylesterase
MLARAGCAATVGCMAAPRRLLPLTASLGVPVMFLAAATMSSIRTFRRLGAAPSGLPELPGSRRSASFEGGVVSFRYIEGIDPLAPPVVLLHGWGSSGDASFFSVLPLLKGPVLVPDLPGHGETTSPEEFSFDLAARAVLAALDAAGVVAPHMVAHSMGGPVALSMLRMRPGCFSRLTAMATSLHWQSPRMSPFLLGAPVLMSPVSPIAMRKLRNRIKAVPGYTEAFVWAWRNRPEMRTLREAARCLHRFDARVWDVVFPPTRWVVPEDDYMVMPSRQRRCARRVGAEVLNIKEAGHSFFLVDPAMLRGIIEMPPPLQH